ncbi:MAG: peptidylprolyl isomerase [Flavobacteriales bacterium]|nr:peptidylprolyl isomerase [Flavobacteriales bacterium]
MKKMIRLVNLTAICLISLFATAQNPQDVILNVAGEEVTLEDFESIFSKNNRDTVITKESLDEYMELFINFKLKVAEARSMGMDTVPSFVTELDGYRRQLARPYLTDDAMLDHLVEEAYNRKTEEVRASHILINCTPTATPEDTLKAWNKINALRDEILGGADFSTVARQHSQDPSAKDNGGDLGYFSVFQMVYPFEEAAYTTPVGQISRPCRSRYGYHIVKVSDRRPALGEIRAAHIMVRAKDKNDAKAVENAEKKIRDIYEQLKSGSRFEDLALKYSEDASTARNGGELPWFGTGKMVESFEREAFALKNDGEYSEPFETEYGWHIVKRLEYRPVPDFKAVQKEIKNRVRRDSRSEKTEQSFIIKMKKEYNFSLNEKSLKPLKAAVDTNMFNGVIDIKAKRLSKSMMMLDGQSYPVQSFYDYLMKHGPRKKGKSPEEVYDMLLDEFVNKTIMDYEDSKLESKYRDFRLLMNEYRDGILLFELTDQKVWSRAVKDTTGLEAFYENNKTMFMWDARVDAVIYSCKDEKTATTVAGMIAKGKTNEQILEKINKDSQLNLDIEEGVYSKEDHPALARISWQKGISKPIAVDQQFVIVNIREVMDPAPKKLDEARGLVTAEYQNYLESEWIKELRNKYAYTVNKEVLYSLVK